MKRALTIVTTFVMALLLMFVSGDIAYAANISIKVSSSSVQIGNTVTATVSVPENVSGTLYLTFPTDVLEFSKASAEVNVNGGTINMSIGKYGLAGGQSVTITFKTKTSGTAKITAKAVDLYDHNELMGVTLGEASASINVENKVVEPPAPSESESTTPSESEKPLSADNSLKSLKLSAGKLSPKFQYNVTKYTATVAYDVEKVVVSAATTNAKAKIESVTGNGTVSLKVGENTIEIVVRAENGVKAVYRIVVTRKAKEAVEPIPSESESTVPSESESTTPSESESTTPSESESQSQQPPESENAALKDLLQWNGEQLTLAGTIPDEKIPEDFKKETSLILNQEIPILSFTKGEMKLLYLLNKNNAGTFYVYDEVQQMIYPFIKLTAEKSYVIVQQMDGNIKPDLKDVFSCTLSIEGKGVINAYQKQDEVEFYLIYCVNHQGEKGWYVFDLVEQTYQRYQGTFLQEEEDTQTGVIGNENSNIDNTELLENFKQLRIELDKAKTIQYIMIIVAVLLALAFVILLVILLQRRDFDDALDDFEIADSEDEEKESIIDKSFAYENEMKPSSNAAAIEKETGTEEVFVADEETVKTEVMEGVDDEMEFYEMPEEVTSDEADDEMEIEFYEMPSGVETEENDDEMEIEFYEMSEEVASDEVDDEMEIEFYEMSETEVVEKETSTVEPSEECEREVQEAVAVQAILNSTTIEDVYDDDDLKFIDL